jgi:uncharacterized membrane protein
MIGTRWTVWVGGLALALGAILLVRYSIERGFFGPGMRVTLGLVLASLLVGAGEFLRRTEDRPGDAPGGAYIPGMLTAAGTIAAFGSIYAAHALYEFIGPSVAFIALGATGLACMAAAALHGPALAGLGLVGSLATPMLVTSAAPNPWPVVVYVGVVAAAAHGLSRWRDWLWLSLAAAAGAGAWAVALLLAINLGFFTATMTHSRYSAARLFSQSLRSMSARSPTTSAGLGSSPPPPSPRSSPSPPGASRQSPVPWLAQALSCSRRCCCGRRSPSALPIPCSSS